MDTLKLLREINKQAAYHNRTIKVLLELHIAEEETKYGLSLDACRQLLEEGEWRNLTNVKICGLMMMASHIDDEQLIRSEFELATNFFDEVRARCRFQYWFFGHYHENMVIEKKFVMLYERIIRLK